MFELRNSLLNKGFACYFLCITSDQCGVQLVLQVRLAADMQVRQPALEVMSKLSRPMGIRDGAIAYTAWRRIRTKPGSSVVPTRGNTNSNTLTGSTANGVVTDRADAKKDEGDTVNDVVDDDDLPMLAMGWDTKMFIWQLTHSNLRKVREWELDSPAVGLAWLEEQVSFTKQLPDRRLHVQWITVVIGLRSSCHSL